MIHFQSVSVTVVIEHTRFNVISSIENVRPNTK